MSHNREQELIDLVFQLCAATRGNNYLSSLSTPQYMEWVSKQLKDNVFDTVPCGASWGVLKNND